MQQRHWLYEGACTDDGSLGPTVLPLEQHGLANASITITTSGILQPQYSLNSG